MVICFSNESWTLKCSAHPFKRFTNLKHCDLADLCPLYITIQFLFWARKEGVHLVWISSLKQSCKIGHCLSIPSFLKLVEKLFLLLEEPFPLRRAGCYFRVTGVPLRGLSKYNCRSWKTACLLLVKFSLRVNALGALIIHAPKMPSSDLLAFDKNLESGIKYCFL